MMKRRAFADSELLQAIGIGAVWLFISLPVYGVLAKTLTPTGFWPHLGLVAIAAAVPPLLLGVLMGIESIWERIMDNRKRGASRDR